ncbi:MAG: FAD-binding oxidoreductase, partial [Candidatus Binatia bacterium]
MSEGDAAWRFAIDGREPQEVVFPESVAQVSQVLRVASEQRTAVAPVGHGAFLHLGNVARRYDLALSLQRLDRIIDYQPADMTVTVEAGMTLARLQTILGEQGQWLPVDPPLPEQATVGGLIATNLSGPARLSQGTIRDFLIGMKAVQSDGTIVKGGGRVVKNVAGYDLPKLYCGSFGTLGVIVEATFKVRPRPQAQGILSLAFPSAEKAMELTFRLLGSELQPFLLELANFDPFPEQGNGTATHPL